MTLHPSVIATDVTNSGLAVYQPSGTTGNVFVNVVPPTPDFAVSIIDFGGEYLSAIDEMITIFQVRVRGPKTGQSNARMVAAGLAERWRAMGWGEPFTMGGSRIVWIEPDPPYLLGWDEQGRPEYAVRVRVRHNI